MSFSMQRLNRGDVQIVAVSGYMGNDECHRVEEELTRLLDEEHQRVILECSALTFATAMSLARLLVVARSFHKRTGALRLAGLSPSITRLAQTAGFTNEMELHRDVPAAMKSLAPPALPRTTRSAPKP